MVVAGLGALVLAAPPVTLEDCTPRDSSRGTRTWECVDATATRTPLVNAATPQAAVDAYTHALRQRFPHAQDPTAAPVRLPEGTVDGWHVSIKGQRTDPRPTAEVDLVVQGTGERRVLAACTRKSGHPLAAKRCALLLQTLLSAPQPATSEAPDPAQRAPGPDLGLGLEAPAACSLTGDRVRCAHAELRVRALPPDDAVLEVREGMARAALERLGAVTSATCAATSPHGDALCRGLVLTGPDGRRVDVAVVLMLRDAGPPLLLECTASVSLADGTPEPCNHWMTLHGFAAVR